MIKPGDIIYHKQTNRYGEELREDEYLIIIDKVRERLIDGHHIGTFNGIVQYQYGDEFRNVVENMELIKKINYYDAIKLVFRIVVIK